MKGAVINFSSSNYLCLYFPYDFLTFLYVLGALQVTIGTFDNALFKTILADVRNFIRKKSLQR